jgi:hypothetical protein
MEMRVIAVPSMQGLVDAGLVAWWHAPAIASERERTH